MVREGKRLLRPAQNCEKAYGGGIVWNEIVELSPTRFREIEIARLDASDVTGLDCLHALGKSRIVTGDRLYDGSWLGIATPAHW